jgi:hypothetical protein
MVMVSIRAAPAISLRLNEARWYHAAARARCGDDGTLAALPPAARGFVLESAWKRGPVHRPRLVDDHRRRSQQRDQPDQPAEMNRARRLDASCSRDFN